MRRMRRIQALSAALYNDCCPVRAPKFNGSTDIVEPLPAEVITCRNFNRSRCANPADDYDDVYVVSRCPNSHDADQIREEGCKMSETSIDPFYRLPVTGNRSGILYGNVYCAVCNKDPEVVFWTVRKEFPNSDDTFERYIFLNPKGQTLRGCVADQTQRRGSSDSMTCQTEQGKCRDRSQSHLFSYMYRDVDLIHSQPFPVCKKNLHRRCRVKSVYQSEPYSVIFDLNSRTIITNENQMNGDWDYSVQVNIMRDCDHGMLYDPFAEICRQIYCRSGSKLTSTGCSVGRLRVNGPNSLDQNNYHTVQSIVSHDTKTLNCTQMIRLNDSEFTLLSNNSAFVHKIGSYYNPDEYLLDRPYLYICFDFIGNDTTQNIAPAVFHFDRVQSTMSFVGILISLVALTIQFVIYMIFPDLRNTPGKCVVCLILSIFSGQLSFLFVDYTGPGCRYLAAFMHFAILASFCWMNVLALDISRTFASKTLASRLGPGSKRFLAYSVYAWLLPATIVGTCLTMDVLRMDVRFRPYYGDGVCWITSRMGLVVFFLVPVALILLSNFILFGITVFRLRRSSKASDAVVDKSRSKGQLILYFRLSVIMGLTWVFGFIATLTQWTVVWYLFILFNTLQGAFLCLAFVCTKNVLNLMRSRMAIISGSSLVPCTEHETPPAAVK